MTFKPLGFSALLILGMALATTAQAADTGTGINLEALTRLDLATAQRMALADNPSLAAAGERVGQAAEKVSQAQAAYLPSVDATASATHKRLSDNAHAANLATARAIGSPTATIDDPEDFYSAKLTATWTLFDGFRRHFATAQARWGKEQSAASRDETRRLLLASVAQGYYGAQLARENIAIAEAGEAFNQRQLQEARTRQRVGTGSLSDVLNFQIQVNAARSERINAEADYRTARIGLAVLMGIPDAHLPPSIELAPLAPESEPDMVRPEAAPLIDYALAHRPDTRQSRFALKQAEAGIGTARADFLPSVQLAGSFDGDRSNSADFEDGDLGDSVGVYLNVNLFSGGLHRARLSEAKRRVAEAEKNLASAEINVASDVQKALSALSAAQAQLSLQTANAALVKQNRDLVEKEYASGQTALVRLNEAQRDLTQARGRLALARASLRRAQADLDASTGKILVALE
ncbi:MAG: TolC family protein [Desulfobacterales bacterium]|nr:TolC family protein [Desulfobacterales bacterium]